ncbi:hypothetical protein ACQBAU_04565 [Propionibacteriaceae bacterium Y2011]
MTWTDVSFPPVPVVVGKHHAAAASGNEAVTSEAIAALRAALAAPADATDRHTHLLLRAAAGAGKSFALRRLVVDAAGAPGSQRIGIVAFTNNQIRPLAEELTKELGKERVCLHLSKDAYAKLPDGFGRSVTVSTQASGIPAAADVIVATASKLKVPREQGRLKDAVGATGDDRLFDVLFVDEAWQLPHHLFDRVEGTAPVIVGVGDVGQLPPLDVAANPWRGDRSHNPYRAWPAAVEGKPTTWVRELPTVWRPPGESLNLWRAFYPTWSEDLSSVAAPGDRRLTITEPSAPSAALWQHVGGGVPTLVEIAGLAESPAPDIDVPLLAQVEEWLDNLFGSGFEIRSAVYSGDGEPTGDVAVARPGESDDGDPLVVILATRNQLVDDAVALADRIREKYGLRDRDLVASTVDSWQGRTNAITIAIHPLTGATELDDFNSAFGRLAVACTRATHGLLMVARAGLDDLLDTAPPRPGTPFGEPGERQLPRQTHQRILSTFARVTVDVDQKENDVATV